MRQLLSIGAIIAGCVPTFERRPSRVWKAQVMRADLVRRLVASSRPRISIRQMVRLPVPLPEDRRVQQLQPYELGKEPPPVLTPRETEVLGLLAQDLSGPAIARRLGVSYWTVREHVRRMHWRAETRTCHGLVAWGIRRGLIE